nr:FAD-dependent oxidoreductase [Bradyrhizobium sp. 2S1]MCK7664912.1 FAD-binding oxidoreductase [Bradyrhizobium sp. 2S1]
MKIAIVGAGIHGLTLAWAFTQRGHSVTILERGSIPNSGNASFDQHRLIHDFARRPSGILPTVTEAFAAWDALACDVGPHYAETGVVHAYSDAAAAAEASHPLAEAGIEHHLLDWKSLAAALPGLSFEKGCHGVMTARGGVLLADRIARSLAVWLVQRGVAMRPHTPVATIDVTDIAALAESGERIRADLLIAAIGAGLAGMFPSLSGRVVARRQFVTYLDPPAHLRSNWRRSPVFVGVANAAELWGAPPVAGTDLKLAAGCLARPGDPASGHDGVVRPEDLPALLACYRPHLPEIDAYEVLRTSVCFYNSTCNGEMIVEAIDGDRRAVWVIAGCDGSDYKFAPALSLSLASRLSRQ